MHRFVVHGGQIIISKVEYIGDVHVARFGGQSGYNFHLIVSGQLYESIVYTSRDEAERAKCVLELSLDCYYDK